MYWNSFLSWNVTATSQSCQDANDVSNGNSLFPFPFPVLLFLCLGPWGAAKACASAALGSARGSHSLSREMPHVDPVTGISGLFLLQHHLPDKRGCLVHCGKRNVLHIHTEGVHLSCQVDSLHQACIHFFFELLFQLLGNKTSNREIRFPTPNNRPGKVSFFFKLNLWPNYLQNSSSDTGDLSFLASQTLWMCQDGPWWLHVLKELKPQGQICNSSMTCYRTSLTLWHLSC